MTSSSIRPSVGKRHRSAETAILTDQAAGPACVLRVISLPQWSSRASCALLNPPGKTLSALLGLPSVPPDGRWGLLQVVDQWANAGDTFPGPVGFPIREDKIHRFADKNSHQALLKPEGLRTHERYPNGISTSLPFEVQYALVRSIKGLENVHIARPGYAIEYDFFDPRDLDGSRRTRAIQGLFFADPINGTTGYEEAAAQGLRAGIDAGRFVKGEEPWWPNRD